MKTNKVKASGFLVVGIIILISVSSILTPKWRYAPGVSEGETDRYQSFYDLPENSLDYITLGSSLSYQSTNPVQIYAETGITGYNLGSSSQGMDVSYYWLKEAYKTQKPTYVFLEVSSLLYTADYLKQETLQSQRLQSLLNLKWSPLKLKAILDCSVSSEMTTTMIFPLYKFHTRWDELKSKDFSTEKSNDYYLNGAFLHFGTRNDSYKAEIKADSFNSYSITEGRQTSNYHANRSDIVEDNRSYFEKIVTFCNTNNITIIPTKFPTKRWTDEEQNAVESYLETQGLTLLDLRNENDIGIQWEHDTHDNGYHTNYWGNAKTSHFLGKYLLKSQGNPDKNSNVEHWENLLANYSHWEQDKLNLDKYKAYNYLSKLAKLAKTKADVAIVIAVRDDASISWNENLDKAMKELGFRTSLYNQTQNSFIGLIDSGENLFEKADTQKMILDVSVNTRAKRSLGCKIISSGFLYGNTSSIRIDGTEYSLNNRGLNIVVIDKATGKVISSASIDTWSPELTFREKTLPDENAAIWEAMCESSQVLENGIYTLSTFSNPDCAVDIAGGSADAGANVALWDKHGLAPQQFYLEHVGDGFYTLQAQCSGKYLSVAQGGNTPGTNVVQEDGTGLAMQKWFLLPNQNGSYSLMSLYNGLMLDVSGGVATAGTNIQMWEDNGEEAQQFFFEKVQIITNGSEKS